MAAAFDLEAHVSDLTKCSICLEDFKDPKSLPCLHTFCLECLSNHFRDKLLGDEVLCPVCRNSCRVPEAGICAFPLNFFINDLLFAQKAAKPSVDELLLCECCSESDGDIPSATKYCIDCDQYVCEKCGGFHAKMKTGAHLVIPLGEEMSSEMMQLRKRHCQEHKDELVKLYCYECKVNICCLCVALNHKQHNFAVISEAADKLGQDIDEQVKVVSDCLGDIHVLEEQWEIEEGKFLSEAEKLEVAIRAKGEEKKKLIDDDVDKLVQELQSVKLKYSKEVKNNKDMLETTAVAIQSYINYSNIVRQKGKPEDITHAADELCTRAATLLQTDILSKSVKAPDIVFIPTDDDRLSDAEGATNLVGSWLCEKTDDTCESRSLSDASSESDVEETDSVSDGLAADVAMTTGAVASSSDADQALKQLSEQVAGQTPPKTIKNVDRFQWYCVAFLDKELLVLNDPSSKQIDVYAIDYSTRGNFTIPYDSRANFVDMAACCFNHCLYLANASVFVNSCSCIVRLKLPSELSTWNVDDIGGDAVISVTSSHDLLVICDKSNELKLFSTDGQLRMTVDLQPDIVSVTSAVELIPGHYLVTHGIRSDRLHRVCLVNSEGKILHAHGGFKGSYDTLLNCPKAVAVDGDGFVYVIEEETDRLVVLNPTLEYIHCIKHDLPPGSRIMKIDRALNRIFVGHRQLCNRSYVRFIAIFEI